MGVTKNPLLPQSEIDAALQEDLAAAKSEYLAEFRDDISAYLPMEVVEKVVVKHRYELLPRDRVQYTGFVDLSGGRGDDAALCIAHKDEKKVIIDLVKRYRPPFNPYEVIGEMSLILHKYRVRRVIGDNYAGEFCSAGFKSKGFLYQKSDLPKSGLYLELIPLICGQQIEIIDNEILVNQIASLERRTRSGGKDQIDHPSGGHDDLANALAGAAFYANKVRRVAGPLW